jgi:hypothetical protein
MLGAVRAWREQPDGMRGDPGDDYVGVREHKLTPRGGAVESV